MKPHLHRCWVNILGGYEERCAGMFECTRTDCDENHEEPRGYCPHHAELIEELVAIMDGRS